MSQSHPEAVIEALYSGDLKMIEGHVTPDNINLLDEDGHTLLSRVATATDVNIKMIRLLVNLGADVNIRLREEWTLLLSAAHLLQKDLAAVLLRAGCDPNAVDVTGQTALMKVLFAFNPKADLIRLLLKHKADPNANHGGAESAIDIATRTGQQSLFPCGK